MPSVTLQAIKSAYLPYQEPNTNDHSSAVATLENEKDALVVGFSQLDNALRYRRIESVALHIYGATRVISDLYVSGLEAPFSEATVTYQSLHGYSGRLLKIRPVYSTDTGEKWRSGVLDKTMYPDGVRSALANGVFIEIEGVGDVMQQQTIATSRSANKPYLVVQYVDADASISITQMTPRGGYVPKKSSSVFSWAISNNGQLSLEPVSPISTVFRWRVSEGGTIHTVSCGTATSVTIPSGTFTEDDVQWSISTTLNTGATVESEWITLTTKEEISRAVIVSPNGIPIDGASVNRFAWQHVISTGSSQTKAGLQLSTDGIDWNDFSTITGDVTYYDVPENTLSAGIKYWRVRTYNTDNVPGEWSASAQIIVIAAPQAPIISVKSTSPRPSIGWQSTDQQAYQVALSNGLESGTVYGVNKLWVSPSYLADGDYTARVRVQNSYGLWSDWSSAALPVRNAPGEAIDLQVSATHKADLLWLTDGSYDFYVIERDGVPIAKTADTRYTDHTSVGSALYRVRGCYNDSYSYGLSNLVSADVAPDTTMICDLIDGQWIALRYSETRTRSSSKSSYSEVALVHLTGMTYPIAEQSCFRDQTLSVSCAFPAYDRQSTLALESLLGKIICVKTAQGDMAIGCLSSLQKTADEFCLRYAFDIQHISWPEVIDLDT